VRTLEQCGLEPSEEEPRESCIATTENLYKPPESLPMGSSVIDENEARLVPAPLKCYDLVALYKILQICL